MGLWVLGLVIWSWAIPRHELAFEVELDPSSVSSIEWVETNEPLASCNFHQLEYFTVKRMISFMPYCI